MPKATQYRLTWHSEQQAYELREHPGGHLFPITPGEQAWFAWLDTVPSFTFWGKLGQFTARKESRQREKGYWYAYHRVGSKLTKKYLGRTADLTLTRLEETAALLSSAEVAPPPEAATPRPSDERTQSMQHSKGEINGDAPTVSMDITTVPSARAGVPRDPLLTTKLHQPRPRSRLVSRSSLVERLQQGMDHALTLVSAPAGFGKTTLLAQWLAESDTPVAWLSLEPEDNDSVRFLTYLIAALQTVDAHLGTPALDLLRTPHPPPPETVVALLTNDLIRSLAGDITLVLDDYHVITVEPIHLALTFLVEHLPAHLHLILATRADDIVISTPPKCGTTWMQMLCALLIFQTPDLPARLTELSPWLDIQTEVRDDVLATLEAQRHRRFIKTHTPLDGIPFDERVTYITVGRDPRDVAVSWDNHFENMNLSVFLEARAAAVGIDDLEEVMPDGPPIPAPDPSDRFWQWIDDDTAVLSGLTGLRGTLHHLSTFWAARDEPNVELFHYADLQADLEGEFRRLAAVLDIDVDDALVPVLIDAARFDSMRSRASELAPQVKVEGFWNDDNRFFHVGGSGQWQQFIGPGDDKRYEKRVRELAAPDLAVWVHTGKQALASA